MTTPAQPPAFPVGSIVRALSVALALITAPLAGQAQPLTYVGAYGEYLANFDPAGYLVGHSFLDSTAEGVVMYGWLGRPDGVTRRVGLYDSLHTSSQGRWYTVVKEVNSHGVSIGTSSIFAGAFATGTSAWVANNLGTTLRIGFYDAEHTSPSGGTLHEPTALNEKNQVVGYSSDSQAYATGWIAGPYTPLTKIGIYDAAHTSSDGRHWSEPRMINDAGYVLGISRYYNGRDSRTYGATTWLYTPWGEMRIVGFRSGIHRTSTGWFASYPSFLTESGYLAGYSNRYRNDVRSGATAWLTHVAGPNRPVGFYDGIHLSSNGVATSFVEFLNENGTAAGSSFQYSAPPRTDLDRAGSTAWVARPSGQTMRVGLYGPAHTYAGRQSNLVKRLGIDDWTVGEAMRFDPATGSTQRGNSGVTAWLADPSGNTVAIEPTGAKYVRSDGHRETHAWGITTRYAWGDALIYSGNPPVRSTGWIYDRVTGGLTVLDDLPNTPPEFPGQDAWVVRVFDDGSFVGNFTSSAGLRSFFYQPGQGVSVLMDVDTSPDAVLQDVQYATPNGYMIGYQKDPDNAFGRHVFMVKR